MDRFYILKLSAILDGIVKNLYLQNIVNCIYIVKLNTHNIIIHPLSKSLYTQNINIWDLYWKWFKFLLKCCIEFLIYLNIILR